MDDNGGGKPVIAVTDLDQTPVYSSYNVVAPFQIADSLADFILALSKMMDIVYGEFVASNLIGRYRLQLIIVHWLLRG
jgi:hypothetical protein